MPEQDTTIERIKAKAVEYDKIGGCTQSVLLSLQEELGIGDQHSFKAGSVMSGGVTRQGETCGALIGALMALGLVVGRERIEDIDQHEEAIAVADEIRERFKAEMGSQFGFEEGLRTTLCQEIQEKVFGRSFNLRNEDEFQEFLDAGGHSDTGCPKVCAIAAQVAAERITALIKT